jgi:hypothetical protein
MIFNFLKFRVPGAFSEKVIPVPIPNTAVKLLSADDTFLGKVSQCQEL